ncbi:MAG: cytochrome c biogenesis protein ResB [Pseudomonadota bacterium]
MEKQETQTQGRGSIKGFFSSVKLSVVLLIVLACTSILGTLIPQNDMPAFYMQKYGEVFSRLFDILGLMDMYHSWWYRLLLALLSVNLVFCSVKRFPAVWKMVSKRGAFDKKRFDSIRQKETFSHPLLPENIKPLYETYFSKKFGAYVAENTDKGFVLFTEKRTLDTAGGVCSTSEHYSSPDRRHDRLVFRIQGVGQYSGRGNYR